MTAFKTRYSKMILISNFHYEYAKKNHYMVKKSF